MGSRGVGSLSGDPAGRVGDRLFGLGFFIRFRQHHLVRDDRVTSPAAIGRALRLKGAGLAAIDLLPSHHGVGAQELSTAITYFLGTFHHDLLWPASVPARVAARRSLATPTMLLLSYLIRFLSI